MRTNGSHARWISPALPAMALQAALLLYLALLTGALEVVRRIGRASAAAVGLVALRDRWVERASRSVASRVLADPRDWPILPVLASVTLLIALSVTLQIVELGVHWIWLALFHHAVLVGARGQRFVDVFSVKHNEAHRPRGFFRGPYRRVLGRFTEGVLGSFYGNLYGLDYINHVRVHHAEDGGPADPQSTYGYDRTSTFDFVRFGATRHLLVSCGYAPIRYLYQRKREREARTLLRSCLLHYGALIALTCWDWRLGLTIAVSPILISNVFASLATWLQHSFQDPEGAGDPIANTITLISPTEFLNEGFHLAHHARSSTHWSELPARFADWRSRYREREPIVLEGIDWIELAVLLYGRRRLDLVAARWRPASDPELSLAARTLLLRRRLGGHESPPTHTAGKGTVHEQAA